MNRKIIFIVLSLAIVIIGAYYWQTNREKEKVESNERKIQQTKRLDKSKQQYESVLKEVCSKPLSEASAVDLYNCQDLKSSEGVVTRFGISPEVATESANLPAFCDRKITEMKMLELLECLDPESEREP